MMETAAPVSTSMISCFPLIARATVMGVVAFAPMVNNCNSSVLLADPASADTHFVFWDPALRGIFLLEGAFFARQIGAI